MSKITGNEPAYAAFSINDRGDGREQDGITIRQRFAMAAMQGMLSSGQLEMTVKNGDDYANMAVDFADALINELNKSEK